MSCCRESSPAHQAGQQTNLHAISKHTTSDDDGDHDDNEPAASDDICSKQHPPDGSSSHQPTSQNDKASVGTGKLDSNAASAAGLSRSTRSSKSKEVQQSSSAAGSGSFGIRLPAPSQSTNVVQEPASSVEPMRAATRVSNEFPEPPARPRPTGKTKSAADVHKQSPDKHLAVQRQHQRKGEGLFCMVPKTSTVGAADLISADLSNQAGLEAPTSSDNTTSQPTMVEAPILTPGGAPPGKVAFPFKLHCRRGQPAGLDDTCGGSSDSSQHSPNITGQAPESVQKAQPVAEAAADLSIVDPTNVGPAVAPHPSVAPPSSADPIGVDFSYAGTSRIDPTGADPNSSDPTKVNPTGRIDPTGVDHNSGTLTAAPQASEHLAAAVTQASHDVQAEERLAKSLAQLLDESSDTPGPGKSTGVENEIQHRAGPSHDDMSAAEMSDLAAMVYLLQTLLVHAAFIQVCNTCTCCIQVTMNCLLKHSLKHCMLVCKKSAATTIHGLMLPYPSAHPLLPLLSSLCLAAAVCMILLMSFRNYG